MALVVSKYGAFFFLLEAVSLKTSRLMLFREMMAVCCAHLKENLRVNKIKFTLEQTKKAQRASRGIALLFL